MKNLQPNSNESNEIKGIKDWIKLVEDNASKWGHVILKITDKKPSRRSQVLWFCSKHPFQGTYICQKDNEKLLELLEENKSNPIKGLTFF
jgi:hypothetical protein